MPNTKKSVPALQGSAGTTLSHETATTPSYLQIHLPGTQAEQIEYLQLYMRMLTTFIIMAVECDSENDNEQLQAAIHLYRETELKRSYLLKGIDE